MTKLKDKTLLMSGHGVMVLLRLGYLSWRLGAWQITASAEALITGYCIENPALSMEAPSTTLSVRQTTGTKRQGTIKVNETYTAG